MPTNIFHTLVQCNDRRCTRIMDAGSGINVILQEVIDKMQLQVEKHPNPYWIAWVNEMAILVRQ